MSIVAYYARLSADQLESCAKNPMALAETSIPGIEVIDIDRAYEPLAWLLSPCKRAEQEYSALLLDEMTQVPESPSFLSRIAGLFKKKGTFQPSETLKAKAAATDATPLDSVLIAIEGRTENRDERFDFGLGNAAVFNPAEVASLNSALQSLAPSALEEHYNPELMDRMRVFPEHWVDEGRDLMDSYVLPSLARLQVFYRAAASEKQHVMVWYT